MWRIMITYYHDFMQTVERCRRNLWENHARKSPSSLLTKLLTRFILIIVTTNSFTKLIGEKFINYINGRLLSEKAYVGS